MESVTSIPVHLDLAGSVEPLLAQVRERIARRAYENYTSHGCVDGNDLDDWLDAERELVIKPAASVRIGDEDIVIEMILPEIDLPKLAVHFAPRQLFISSVPDADGLQLCQMIDLPLEISLDGLDAAQMRNLLRITAALAKVDEPQLV
jgi:hypothetical protein